MDTMTVITAADIVIHKNKPGAHRKMCPLFVLATSQSPSLLGILATAYNTETCPLGTFGDLFYAGYYGSVYDFDVHAVV